MRKKIKKNEKIFINKNKIKQLTNEIVSNMNKFARYQRKTTQH